MESLQEYWPEPIVPVQSLSDLGANVIPDRYVKPPAERPTSLVESGTECDARIPVIDLAGLTKGVTECRATMKAISDACKEWGFFQVVNHGVSLDLVAKIREVWKDFFYLIPLEEKKKLANSPKNYEGYGSRLGVDKDAILDWGDYFFLNLLPHSDNWPLVPTPIREVTEEYGRELAKLCETVMKVLSMSLGLEVGFLQKAFGGTDVGMCTRVNFYPKCPRPDLTMGLSAHSDPGGLTVLLADDRVRGLQVRRDDTWVTVHPFPDSFIINIGDQIQVLSNATFKSIEHRVITNSTEERLSIAFFYNPRSDLPVAPAQELVMTDRPQLYQPMTFGEYRLFIRKKGPRGKAQVESLKAL